MIKTGIERIVGNADVYELRVYDFLCVLDPPPNFKLPRIDPQEYFVTSGDAIEKTKYLIKVLWNYAGDARKQFNKLSKPTAKDIKFEKLCWEQAGAAKKLQHALEEVRGEAVFLETEWQEHTVRMIPKNPRPRPVVD